MVLEACYESRIVERQKSVSALSRLPEADAGDKERHQNIVAP
ncbi:MAG: hypothetical protein AVDCRST_MAG28-2743 [uncultured Rubrobacteraceae bacterium]|uniref:Uncharacterized protein n=1 Tax=uncultured Rubrobacteraceae bacterium TaxID=349277 RepID=A0A6J4R763_9ACTN|nr:MAG: hypothetical protein AVDCRST_MAG28-2743 [uncultured Rubrobacteraceae bacterium]